MFVSTLVMKKYMKERSGYSRLVLSVLFFASCNELYNHPLGNNLSIWDGDKKEDKVIVYCTGNCHGGIYMVPTYDRHYDSRGNYAEYLETADSDKKWVIAKTLLIKENKENYWIISKDFDIDDLDCGKVNCDSILQRHVVGPLSLNEFKDRKRTLGIAMDF